MATPIILVNERRKAILCSLASGGGGAIKPAMEPPLRVQPVPVELLGALNSGPPLPKRIS